MTPGNTLRLHYKDQPVDAVEENTRILLGETVWTDATCTTTNDTQGYRHKVWAERQTNEGSIPGMGRGFCLLRNVQSDSTAHTPSCPNGTDRFMLR